MKRYKVRQRIEVNRVRNKRSSLDKTSRERKRERKSMSPSASVKATE